MKWQRRRSEHDAAAVSDDHATDSADDAAYAGHQQPDHRHPGVRIDPTGLRLDVPSRRLRIDVSPGLQRRRRRRDDAGQCGAGHPVRPHRDSIAARLEMRAYNRVVSVRTLHGGTPGTCGG